MKAKMVQYGVWPNCSNNCKFCLRKNRKAYTKHEQLHWLKKIQKNIKTVDWKNEFPYGISLLGGELYNVTDHDVQHEFLNLIDVIIEHVLLRCNTDICKYSTVTNGIYDPSFLYSVIDRIVGKTSIRNVDLNFSYDLKYRYASEHDRMLVLKNINEFHDRYDYEVGVQMILTQYVIDLWKSGKFSVNEFVDANIPGNHLCFLYPHPINSGCVLDDFNFRRCDFLDFVHNLQSENFSVFMSFLQSTKNSGTFKYTGYKNRFNDQQKHAFLKRILAFLRLTDVDFSDSQPPELSDGKEILTECGHSVLYRCYSDSSRCMLCDLKKLYGDMV